jgi:hypothetical protein
MRCARQRDRDTLCACRFLCALHCCASARVRAGGGLHGRLTRSPAGHRDGPQAAQPRLPTGPMAVGSAPSPGSPTLKGVPRLLGGHTMGREGFVAVRLRELRCAGPGSTASMDPATLSRSPQAAPPPHRGTGRGAGAPQQASPSRAGRLRRRFRPAHAQVQCRRPAAASSSAAWDSPLRVPAT